MLFSTVTPCTIFDNCENAQLAGKYPDAGKQKDCNGCSPFSVCSSAHVFTVSSISILVEPVIFNSDRFYNEFYLSAESGYHSSLFQPPRSS